MVFTWASAIKYLKFCLHFPWYPHGYVVDFSFQGVWHAADKLVIQIWGGVGDYASMMHGLQPIPQILNTCICHFKQSEAVALKVFNNQKGN